MKKISLGFLVLLFAACSAPYRLITTFTELAPTPIRSEVITPSLPREGPTQAVLAGTSSPSPQPGETPQATATIESGFTGLAPACSYQPITAQLLEQTSQEQWIAWVARLSGAEPVSIGGEETRIETRYSPSLFNGQSNARAFDWLLQQVQEWYPVEQIEVQPFKVEFEDQELIWKNLIITLPGQTRPDEVVVLSAHLDSTSSQPTRLAPGAEDNASGSATLLEAARLFRTLRFERTIQIVWFTGEEQGLFGSRAFVKAAQADHQQIIGAINLDMFGYDSDNDQCFELHVGELPASHAIGQCFQTSMQSYQPNLKADYLTGDAIDRSDHGSFWQAGIGAIEVLENLFDNQQPNGCTNRDASPNYHSDQDVVTNLNPETAFSIAKASLAAVVGLAQPLQP